MIRYFASGKLLRNDMKRIKMYLIESLIEIQKGGSRNKLRSTVDIDNFSLMVQLASENGKIIQLVERLNVSW